MGKEKGTVAGSRQLCLFLMGDGWFYTIVAMISSRLAGSKSMTGISGMV